MNPIENLNSNTVPGSPEDFVSDFGQLDLVAEKPKRTFRASKYSNDILDGFKGLGIANFIYLIKLAIDNDSTIKSTILFDSSCYLLFCKIKKKTIYYFIIKRWNLLFLTVSKMNIADVISDNHIELSIF
jgi:hypothetical protein